jgi:hypothetical protein
MKEEIFEIDGITFKIFRHRDSNIQLIYEANEKGRQLIGTYTYDIHKPHNPTGEYHIHLYEKGNQILSINKISGTGHDGYHGIRIPNKAYKQLKAKFSDWNWPENQIIESINYTYLVNKNSSQYLRPVKVFSHKNHELQDVVEFVGFFHQFAEDPFFTGGNGGWKERTIAIIETEEGYIKKVPVNAFKFKDINE